MGAAFSLDRKLSTMYAPQHSWFRCANVTQHRAALYHERGLERTCTQKSSFFSIVVFRSFCPCSFLSCVCLLSVSVRWFQRWRPTGRKRAKEEALKLRNKFQDPQNHIQSHRLFIIFWCTQRSIRGDFVKHVKSVNCGERWTTRLFLDFQMQHCLA